MTKRLEMVFRTAGGRRSTLSIDDPIDDLEASSVEDVMETIVAKNIFYTNSGDLEGLIEARITSRETVQLFMNA